VNSSSQQAVLVLGMHRSGTSALTAGLEALGFSLGQSARKAADGNEKGFFENWDVVSLNNRLLRMMGGGWDAPPSKNWSEVNPDEVATLATLAAEAADVLRRHYADAPRWALKDPRLCLTLPFWRAVIASADLGKLHCVHVIRSPLDVALSQRQRHRDNPGFHIMGEDCRYTLLLWYVYHQRAVLGLSEENSCFVRHADMVENPASCLRQLATLLGVSAGEQASTWFAEEFVEQRLHHQRTSVPDLREDFPSFGFVQDFHEALHSVETDRLFDGPTLRARLHPQLVRAGMEDDAVIEDLIGVVFEAGAVAAGQRQKRVSEQRARAHALREMTEARDRLASELQAIQHSWVGKLARLMRGAGR
jgi:hypothetical protein